MTSQDWKHVQRLALMMLCIVLAQTWSAFAASGNDYSYLEYWPYTWFQWFGAHVCTFFGGCVTLP